MEELWQKHMNGLRCAKKVSVVIIIVEVFRKVVWYLYVLLQLMSIHVNSFLLTPYMLYANASIFTVICTKLKSFFYCCIRSMQEKKDNIK
jgi:hypothetical protein